MLWRADADRPDWQALLQSRAFLCSGGPNMDVGSSRDWTCALPPVRRVAVLTNLIYATGS